MSTSVDLPLASFDLEEGSFAIKDFPLKEKYNSLIHEFGWEGLDLLSDQLLQNHKYCDFLQFLYESKLIFSIRGFENKDRFFEKGIFEGIKVFNGTPYILKEGRWTHWKSIIDTFTYDSSSQEILEKGGSIAWNYFYPNGLVPESRYSVLRDAYQISEKQLKEIRSRLNDQSKGAEHFLQVTSSGEGVLEQIGSHIGIRLITNRKLYSFGFEIPRKGPNLENQSNFSALATYPVRITNLDFTEFKKHKLRRITTIPINEETSQVIVEKIRKYMMNESRLTLCFLDQNCVNFTAEVLKEANENLDYKTQSITGFFGYIFYTAICNYPSLYPIVLKVEKAFISALKALDMCKPIALTIKILGWVWSITTYLPSKILTVIRNLFFILFGANQSFVKFPKRQEDACLDLPLLYHQPPLREFSGIFQEHLLSDPLRVINWQRTINSTVEFTDSSTQFCI